MDYLPVTDPSGRYEADHELALKAMKQEFLTLQRQLRHQALVRLNKNAF